jgi:peptidoglycan/xylan/chitin deacetylase (PgdA/CDA1 family)
MQLSSPALLEGIFALKGNFSAGLFPAAKQPSPGIQIAPFKNNARAAVCISGDFELSWAFRSSGQAAARNRGTTERNNMPVILDLLEQYSIPVTWATVGHLFLESCRRSASGVAHPEMPRPLTSRWEGDWYMHDPCTDVHVDPLWYCPDLVQKILECKTPHEIGTHSFSHIDFSKGHATSELVRREFDACIEAMAPFGLRPRSFVFPHNHMDYEHASDMVAAGLTAIRHRDKNVRLSYPERMPSGMYRLYESMNLRASRHYDYVEKARIFIQKAVQRQALYSIWFHPSDPAGLFENQFYEILRHIDERRSAGELWVTTMGDLAAYCEARECLQTGVERGDDFLLVSIKSSLDTARYGTPELTLNITLPGLPKTAWQQFSNGTRTPLHFGPLLKGTQGVAVNVPADVRLIHFGF